MKLFQLLPNKIVHLACNWPGPHIETRRITGRDTPYHTSRYAVSLFGPPASSAEGGGNLEQNGKARSLPIYMSNLWRECALDRDSSKPTVWQLLLPLRGWRLASLASALRLRGGGLARYLKLLPQTTHRPNRDALRRSRFA